MFLTEDGKVPVHWWTKAVNFGDLLSPWLVKKISGRDICFAAQYEHAYVVIGSIIGHATENSVVWGTGSFGTESLRGDNPKRHQQFSAKARYHAVRGPLTRNKLKVEGIECPRVYGDPALLVPDYYRPAITPEYEVGVVLRWSEKELFDQLNLPWLKKIYLKSDDIEGTIDAILSCKRIISSSLHGLILADAYHIPNVWLDSDTPHGLEFKYWDYLISVNKVRPATQFDFFKQKLELSALLDMLPFDERIMTIDLDLLRQSCPFVPGKEADIVVPKVQLGRRWKWFGPLTLSQ